MNESLALGLIQTRSACVEFHAGTEPVHGLIRDDDTWNGAVCPLIPHDDTIRLLAQFPDLHLALGRHRATAVSDDGALQLVVPVVFAPGLTCYDFRGSGWLAAKPPEARALAA